MKQTIVNDAAKEANKKKGKCRCTRTNHKKKKKKQLYNAGGEGNISPLKCSLQKLNCLVSGLSGLSLLYSFSDIDGQRDSFSLLINVSWLQ